MLSAFISSLVAAALTGAIMAVAWVLSYRSVADREKSSPFECGFDSMGSARLPFSLRFFLLAVIFLIFDIEIVLLFPAVVNLFRQINFFIFLGVILFLLILIFGLFHEWNEGSLDWVV
uniref:NADH dehydrogenase subunit 3 n=1 Tax=Bayerotrochus charlestonensis TaxID=3243989 RepID=UPI001E6FB4D3|nr:NADH dehydrogenase subunit 3 [Perotrochus charlestonensis]UDL72163.1 NADH dehydrogenase subunit 3 [Perotrochus charlestonensis]